MQNDIRHIQLDNGESICIIEKGAQFKCIKPTLLFIHGNMSSKIWWYDTIQILQKYDYHIVAVDQRGFGESSYNKPCSTFAHWAQDMIDLCEKLQIKQCVSIGWSFGGGICMKMAEMAPNLVVKVIPTCSVSHQGLIFTDNNGVKCISREQIVNFSRFKHTNSIIAAKDAQKMDQIFSLVIFTVAHDYPKDKRAKIIQDVFKQRNYFDVLYAIANPDITIQKIKAKGLVIHGRQDIVVPLDTLTSTMAYFKNSVILDENAHIIPMEKIQWYAQAVRAFTEEK